MVVRNSLAGPAAPASRSYTPSRQIRARKRTGRTKKASHPREASLRISFGSASKLRTKEEEYAEFSYRSGSGGRRFAFGRRRRAGQSDGRRSADVFDEEHHPECRELQGPYDARRRGEGGRARRYLVGQGSVHGLCADQ